MKLGVCSRYYLGTLSKEVGSPALLSSYLNLFNSELNPTIECAVGVTLVSIDSPAGDISIMGGKDHPDPALFYASMANRIVSANVCAYAEIVAKHKKQRNMIEIKFSKNRKEGETGKLDRSVDLKTVSEYIFGELKIDSGS